MRDLFTRLPWDEIDNIVNDSVLGWFKLDGADAVPAAGLSQVHNDRSGMVVDEVTQPLAPSTRPEQEDQEGSLSQPLVSDPARPEQEDQEDRGMAVDTNLPQPPAPSMRPEQEDQEDRSMAVDEENGDSQTHPHSSDPALSPQEEEINIDNTPKFPKKLILRGPRGGPSDQTKGVEVDVDRRTQRRRSGLRSEKLVNYREKRKEPPSTFASSPSKRKKRTGFESKGRNNLLTQGDSRDSPIDIDKLFVRIKASLSICFPLTIKSGRAPDQP